MVREVEFSNISEVLGEGQDYANSADQQLFVGSLADDGETLNIKVRVPLMSELFAKRKLFLYYYNVNFEDTISEYVVLGDTDPDFCNNINSEFTDRTYSFDLSSVLTIPKKIYSTAGSFEIIVESYTYEANFNTDYGTKRLSTPYTISSSDGYTYDKSTDGVYKLIMIDFEPWVDTRVYSKGDIVLEDTGLIVSLIDRNSELTSSTIGWEAATDKDIFNYSNGNTGFPPLRAVVTDLMLSRYAKYSIIKDVLLGTGFKEYNDTASYETALLLQNYREKAKYSLIAHKPVHALYNLQLLKLASKDGVNTTQVYNYNIKYTA